MLESLECAVETSALRRRLYLTFDYETQCSRGEPRLKGKGNIIL